MAKPKLTKDEYEILKKAQDILDKLDIDIGEDWFEDKLFNDVYDSIYTLDTLCAYAKVEGIDDDDIYKTRKKFQRY